jgi:hypothetical protein
MNSLNQCPKCKKNTWHFNVYLHITAPGEMYHQLSKRNLRKQEVKIEAALWETTSWWCSNYKCMHHIDGPKRVRLEDIK